jgi:hypothetical protein
MLDPKKADSSLETRERARAISKAGGVEQALGNGLPKLAEMTLSEAIVLGLLNQGVRKYFAIFGHGSTDLGNILRIYEEEGATRTINCRNEVEMAHAATALRWQYGELSAVVTSIGPGAMQAFTNDHVAVDYQKLASSVSGVLAVSGGVDAKSLRAALKIAHGHNGLSVVHVPVYYGPDELGGLGAWGEWNVGNWCDDVQASWIKQDL